MKAKTTKFGEAVAGYLFLMPSFVGFIIFTGFPVIGSLLLSFSDWNMITPPVAVGLSNYQKLPSDPLLMQSLSNTAYFSLLSVPLNILLALLLAILINNKLRGTNFLKAAYFLPTIYSTVAVALIWQWIYDYRTGLLNYFFGLIHLGPYPWLTSTKLAMISVVGVAVWRGVGYNMLIFLAGLQGVSVDLYEAARIDGTNQWQMFWHVTVPMISPSTFFVTITSIINSFQVFDITTVLTAGGPGNATNTLVMLIYQHAFQFFRMGYASAIAYVLFGIVLVLTLIQTTLSKRWVHY
ncbi:MAG TPA: sugar ABC transporter permease [Firmicutes bacterium]|jgi:multiple sugar transport system permease protein|nr:sugar ABC transporter permease [Bacillota bacterium]